MNLGPDYVGGGAGRRSNFSCMIASTVAATECGCALLWSKRIPLDNKPLHLLLCTNTKNGPQLAAGQQCNLKVVPPSLKKIANKYNTN
jgi:hypothetical protein